MTNKKHLWFGLICALGMFIVLIVAHAMASSMDTGDSSLTARVAHIIEVGLPFLFMLHAFAFVLFALLMTIIGWIMDERESDDLTKFSIGAFCGGIVAWGGTYAYIFMMLRP